MRTLRILGLVVFNVAVTVAFLGAYVSDPAHFESRVTVQWILLYVVAVGHPILWMFTHYRTFKRLGVTIDEKTHALAWSPVYVGGTTLLLALTLMS
jgi:hypothetical protein